MESLKFNLKAISFLLKNPKLWKYCIAPILISMIAMIAILYLMFAGFQNISFTPASNQEVTGIAAIVNWLQIHLVDGVLKWILFILLALLFVWYGFSIVASLLSFPFLEFLSNEVEKELRGKELNYPWYAGLVGSFLFSISLLILKLILIVGVFVVSLMFPPFVIVNFFVISWFCSIESIDYCMSRNLYRVNDKLQFLLKQKFSLISLGSFSALLLLVPLIGLLQPMLAVVSCAMFFVSKTP